MIDSARQNENNAPAAGFTIIELLVVIVIISMLMAILLPALGAAKNSTKMIVCQNNLKQLTLANQGYANDNDNYSVPGAINIDTSNLDRWYGKRDSIYDPFDRSRGPLVPYLDQADLSCPQKVNYTELEPHNELYEKGHGGYGYNLVYIGSQIWHSGLEKPDTSTSTKLTAIARPQETLLFADTAMAKRYRSNEMLIRYSFAEPRYFVVDKEPSPVWNPPPSIHFRHRKRACVGWADGHADNRKTAGYDKLNDDDGIRPLDYSIGWFEPMDNSLFDLK